MKIVFSGLTLGDDENDLPISSRTINGEAVSEAVDIVAAAQKRFYFRGNEAVVLGFSVRREFATLREAEVFWLTHWSLIPKAGLCQITCGNGDDTQDVFIAGAICTGSPQGTCRGVEVVLQYQIVGPEAATDVPPEVLAGAQPMIERGAQALTAADASKAIVFGAPFTTKPVVTASIAKPSGGDNISATVRNDLTSVNGFTVELSYPIPGAGYVLNWIAVGN